MWTISSHFLVCTTIIFTLSKAKIAFGSNLRYPIFRTISYRGWKIVLSNLWYCLPFSLVLNLKSFAAILCLDWIESAGVFVILYRKDWGEKKGGRSASVVYRNAKWSHSFVSHRIVLHCCNVIKNLFSFLIPQMALPSNSNLISYVNRRWCITFIWHRSNNVKKRMIQRCEMKEFAFFRRSISNAERNAKFSSSHSTQNPVVIVTIWCE